MEQRIIDAVKKLPQDARLRLFIEDELAFYKTYCNQFTSRTIREKKILEFENPNRMRVTYEFDVNKLDKTEAPLFIFLPDTRKNWMKVMWEGRRLTVSSTESVRGTIFKIVEKDLDRIKTDLNYSGTPRKLWEDQIWPGHIPCFVDGSFIKNQWENGQMVVEYYDTFETFKPVGHKWSLFDERRYVYNYAMESGSSHWFYVKAPEKFQVVTATEDGRAKDIPGNDPEIKAYRIIPDAEKSQLEFNIDIRVPRTLKWWYGMIVLLAGMFLLAFLVLGILFIVKGKPLTPVFAQVGISFVAAIIASRGWMMNDETVLKRVSNIMTAIASGILVLLVAMYAVAGLLG